MITAKEARERIDALKAERSKQEMKTVDEIITTAIEKGKSYCRLGICISEPTEEWLKRLGYQVEHVSSQKDGIDVKVSW